MEDDNNVMQDESILKRSQNSDNAYVNECVKEVCIHGDSLNKYKTMLEKKYGLGFYDKCNNFVKEVAMSVQRRKFTNTSVANVRFLANEIYVTDETVDEITKHYSDLFAAETEEADCWNGCATKSDYEGYLKKFPSGKHKAQALNKVKEFEEAEREAKAKAEALRLRKEQERKEQEKRESEERKARDEAARKAKEESERNAREEAARKAEEEAKRKFRENMIEMNRIPVKRISVALVIISILEIWILKWWSIMPLVVNGIIGLLTQQNCKDGDFHYKKLLLWGGILVFACFFEASAFRAWSLLSIPITALIIIFLYMLRD